MRHIMNLYESPFRKIESGIKTIELRLYDEKRRAVKIGDEIEFHSLSDPSRTLVCRVIALHLFDSFDALYSSLPLTKCGYTEENVGSADPSDMEEYYTVERQKECGVVGIEIELIK